KSRAIDDYIAVVAELESRADSGLANLLGHIKLETERDLAAAAEIDAVAALFRRAGAIRVETADVLDALEQMERLIAAAEARREAMLERIDDHRQSPGERVRKAAAEVVDAEFEDLPVAATQAPPSATSAA
ncbi:MAG TPA: hypothetical protein VEM36_14270, partial [Xanthobacteraceae bacterium]|nr:hypothetical protein [Xanthobacteraceae bacterium]